MKDSSSRQGTGKNTLILGVKNIPFALVCLLLVDITIMGSGHWLKIGHISFRMFISAVAIILALRNTKTILKIVKDHLVYKILVAMALYFVFSIINGIVNGNRIDILVGDIKGFIWFTLIIAMVSEIDSYYKVIFTAKLLVVSGAVQALIIFIINLLISINPNLYSSVSSVIVRLGVGSIGVPAPGVYRIFFKSSVYLIVSYVLLLQLVAMKEVGTSAVFLAPILIFSILISFTRSLYLAILLAVLLLMFSTLVVGFSQCLRLMRILVITMVLSLLLILGVQQITKVSYLTLAFERVFYSLILKQSSASNIESYESEQPSASIKERFEFKRYIEITENSDNLRTGTSQELIESFVKKPLFGNGFGKTIALREDGLVEYFFLDLLVKTGILGTLLYIFPFIFLLIKQFSIIPIRKKLVAIAVNSGLMGFFIASYFNPFMNSSLGIAFYCYAITVYTALISDDFMRSKKESVKEGEIL